MFRTNNIAKFLFTLLVTASVNLSSLPVRGNDLVPSDDLVGGASVFVFRGSRKRPQEKGGGGGVRVGGGRVRSYNEGVNKQIAATRTKKVTQAKSRKVELAKARARERNAKLKLSNTLAARAETQMESGDITSAITSFRESLKANPKNAEASSGLSEALTAKGIEAAGDTYNESAVVYFNEAVKLDSRNEIAYTKLGEIHDARGRNALAVSNYEKALALDPSLSSLYMPIGLAYVESGDMVKAESYLAKAEASGTDGGEGRFARGILLAKQNKNTEAIAAFDRIIAAEPQNAGAYYQRAVVYDRLDQRDKSVAGFKEAIRIDPAYAAPWFDLGVIHYNKGDYNEAINAYKEAIRLDPNNGRAHANLGSTYRQLERYPEANAEYKIAAETVKDDADLYSEWGFTLGKTGDWEQSAARLETARTLNPGAIDHNNVGWAQYNRAQVEKQNNRQPEATANYTLAKASLQKSVELDPKLDAAHLNLGSTNNGLGEHDEAVASLNTALTLKPDWVIALNQLGLGYRGMNNLELAIVQFTRSTTVDSNNLFGLFNLGSAQHANGDKKGAKKTQERLKKLDASYAAKLGAVLAGKIIINEAERQIRKKIPIPRLPF